MINHRRARHAVWAVSWPPTGRNGGHQWAGLLAAGGQKPLSLDRPRSLRETCWWTTATTATFRNAVRENEEVVPVNVSTWVLSSGVTVGR